MNDGTSYNFNVYGMNSLGIGAGSDITITPSYLPDAPIISNVQHGDTYISLYWDAPNNYGAEITLYNIYKSIDGGNSYSFYASTASTSFTDENSKKISKNFSLKG